MDNVTTTPKLAEAVAAARAEMTAPVKSGHNTFDHYDYATAADLAAVVMPAICKQGLWISATTAERIFHEDRQTSRGGVEHVAEVVIDVTLAHSSGESRTIQVRGLGQDRSDKALPKAYTAAQKSAFQLLFWLPAADDPEATSDGRNDPPPQQQQERQQRPDRSQRRRQQEGQRPSDQPRTEQTNQREGQPQPAESGAPTGQQSQAPRKPEPVRYAHAVHLVATTNEVAKLREYLEKLPSSGFTPEHSTELEAELQRKIKAAEDAANAEASAAASREQRPEDYTD